MDWLNVDYAGALSYFRVRGILDTEYRVTSNKNALEFVISRLEGDRDVASAPIAAPPQTASRNFLPSNYWTDHPTRLPF